IDVNTTSRGTLASRELRRQLESGRRGDRATVHPDHVMVLVLEPVSAGTAAPRDEHQSGYCRERAPSSSHVALGQGTWHATHLCPQPGQPIGLWAAFSGERLTADARNRTGLRRLSTASHESL